jgi:hypothetical protein
VEQVIPPGNTPSPGKFLDLSLLGKAGLSLQRIVPTPSPVSVVEAVAA